MKMKFWTQRLTSGQSNKYEVKLNHLKLELGLFGAKVGGNETVAIHITAKPASSSPKSHLTLPFHRTSKRQSTHTTHRRLLSKTSSLLWDTHDLRDFHFQVKHDSPAACDMAFHVSHIDGNASAGKPHPKTTVVGKASVQVLVREETKTESNSHIQRKLPIELKVKGLSIQATLSVSVSFLKLRNSHDSPKPFQNSVGSEKKRNGKNESYESRVLDSDDSSNEFTTRRGRGNSMNNAAGSNPTYKLKRITSSETETRLDTGQRSSSMLSWNRRSFKDWSFSTTTRTTHSDPCLKSDEFSHIQGWQVKKLMCRDGRAKLNTNVFFASFDQRSEKACGESACAALATVIAHWLHANQDMPTRSEFDNLITEGSCGWRGLCDRDAHLKLFPDKHFDLETVIEANLRPLVVLPEISYTGFFSPDKFECLKGAMSFDEIWDEINRNVVDYESRIYIVGWNDHFFVLKVEADAYYIIDSLGERLFEGCQQAFILKFDDSSSMYEKVDKAEEFRWKGSSGVKSAKSEKESLELVCSGKECCKEFIKRFLAALPLKQLEEEAKKGSVSHPYLHRLLQIDFHYSFPSSSFSASSSASSLFSTGTLEAELCS